ncbi:MAG: SCP2 sterol-binding domain-containing protein [Candidatus Promineifilaceae bacterium]|nr:SCP2 sterol-binding domain-containing protein [Candidatus Promineifilaceae bacterium]
MPVFRTTDELYACLEALFERVQRYHPNAADDIEQARVIIGLRCTDPDGQVLINGRRRPATVSVGDNRIRPEVAVSLETDVLHQILMGELGLARALSERRMRVRGPIIKALALADLFRQCQAHYEHVLTKQGII